MNILFNKIVSSTLNISERQVENTIRLLDEGATIPFISRYRKEVTGALDEVQISNVKEQYDKLRELEKRKQTIITTIGEQGKLTPDLRTRLENSWNAMEIEDIYLTYRPKRRTRAEVAREKGLEPLAKILMIQTENNLDIKAQAFVKNDVVDTEEALKGARDIIAEWISENERARNMVRSIFRKEAIISSRVVKGKEEEAAKYRDYFDWSEPLRRCSSHRLLAVRRGESEGFLKVSIEPDSELCIERLEGLFVKNATASAAQVNEAVRDGYKRLLKPSIETEFAALSKERADDEAIRVFTENLRQLLLAAPLGQKRVMGIDPGYRTGCKLVCLDEQGDLLHNETIYPHPPKQDVVGASRKVTKLVEAYNIQAIAIGNGTASRVNVNTASKHLLTYVSGLGPQLAQNIVDYRQKNGAFTQRKQLMKVPRMGEKAFEQSAGFLRIPGAENPLDNSAVHPESYAIVERMAKDLNCTVRELIGNKDLKKKLHLEDYISGTVGMLTINDIISELDKPGRDPRQTVKVFEFDPTVRTIEDLKEGQVLPGIVTNITNFGCFVDIGIKENGLVHISQLANKYISDPTEIISLHQHVTVKVIGIDLERKRVQLSMKDI